jgi:hypothetical protein
MVHCIRKWKNGRLLFNIWTFFSTIYFGRFSANDKLINKMQLLKNLDKWTVQCCWEEWSVPMHWRQMVPATDCNRYWSRLLQVHLNLAIRTPPRVALDRTPWQPHTASPTVKKSSCCSAADWARNTKWITVIRRVPIVADGGGNVSATVRLLLNSSHADIQRRVHPVVHSQFGRSVVYVWIFINVECIAVSLVDIYIRMHASVSR